MSLLTQNDEQRLRELAVGMARGMEDEDELLRRLGFTRADYGELSETRTFKLILSQATSEWEGANNTRKRIEMKAAVNVEQALPHFYRAMTDEKEPLSSKVKTLEIVARIGKLGNPEVAAGGSGQFFKLEINLGGGKHEEIVIEHHNDERAVLHEGPEELRESEGYSLSNSLDKRPVGRPRISPVWTGKENDEL